ncbi:histidine--tRNA ligase, cytoplasmic [Tanacetum coccineum]
MAFYGSIWCGGDGSALENTRCGVGLVPSSGVFGDGSSHGLGETQVLVSIWGDDYNLAVKLVTMCWDANLKAEFLVNKRRSKHFDHAKKLGIPWIVLVGEQEITKGVVTLKNTDAQVEKEVHASDFVDELVKLINTPQS